MITRTFFYPVNERGTEMTPEQAKIVILEDALIQAHHTVSFLHGCLTNEKFRYYHPEQTYRSLHAWSQIVSIPEVCVHSVYKEDCKSCQSAFLRHKLLCQAKGLIE